MPKPAPDEDNSCPRCDSSCCPSVILTNMTDEALSLADIACSLRVLIKHAREMGDA